jgi:hypothetical protein
MKDMNEVFSKSEMLLLTFMRVGAIEVLQDQY